MGPTQMNDKIVNCNDPLVITGNYEESKIKCENFLKKYADNYLIFRLAGVLPTSSTISFTSNLPLMEEIFNMHPDMRLEMIMDLDVITALINGAEKLKLGNTKKNQAYILAGGEKNGWRLRGEEFLSRLFESIYLQIPDQKYFTKDINSYHLDWYDTKEAQNEFNFQNHTIDDYFQHMKKSYRIFKIPIILLRKSIMKRLVKMSPYYNNPAKNTVKK